MLRFEQLSGRLAVPVLAGALGAILYIASPVAHQAFCATQILPVLSTPVVVAPALEAQ